MISKEVEGNIKEFSEGGWYHQRFDACPQFIHYIGESEVMSESRKPKGTEAKIRLSFYEGGKADWYLAMDDLREGTEALIELAKRNKNIGPVIMKKWKRDERNFDAFFEKFKKLDLQKLSDDKLSELYKRFLDLAYKRNSSSSIIDHFALGSDVLINKMLRREAGSFEKESQFTNFFSAVTAPVHQSFLNKAEEDLIKLAIKIKQHEIGTEEKRRLLRSYSNKYFWLQNNYFISQKLDENYFEKEVEAWINTKKDLKRQLREIKDNPRKNDSEKRRLLQIHKLSPLLRTLLKISEMAKRIGYTLDEMKYLMPSETLECFHKKNISREELSRRKKFCAVLVIEGESKVFTGDDAALIKKTAISTKKDEEIRDIRGLVACTGRAVGTAKILSSATEINKIEEGDILIAVMTRPDYAPAMRKAAAIVTDEGGLTCHAAIVSREFRKPCIIGTKIATKVFKDGDRVEVNANHNWIRKTT